jgi:hypothetical protein
MSNPAVKAALSLPVRLDIRQTSDDQRTKGTTDPEQREADFVRLRRLAADEDVLLVRLMLTSHGRRWILTFVTR